MRANVSQCRMTRQAQHEKTLWNLTQVLTRCRLCVKIACMTTAPQGRIPAVTLPWRLKMALSEGGVSREEIAEALGVTPSTCSRWMNGHGEPPRRAYIDAWALATGVDRDWLHSGTSIAPPPPPGLSTRRAALAADTERRRRRATGHRGGDLPARKVPIAVACETMGNEPIAA